MRAATPDLLERLHRVGALSDAAFARALELSCASPGVQRWRRYLDWLLLGLGASLVLASIVFFVAFNWSALHPFAKLSLTAMLVAASAGGAWKMGLDSLVGRICLTGAAVLEGPLLAIYGQTYQTGADPYSLFLAWAALAALWVAISRFPPAWLVELLLLDLALALFWTQVLEADLEWHPEREHALFLTVGAVQIAAWALWEAGARRGVEWMSARWMPRVLAVASLFLLSASSWTLALGDRWDRDAMPALGLGVLTATLIATLVIFTKFRRDLFMIALALGTAMVWVTTFLGRWMFEGRLELGAVFVLGVIVIGEVGAAAFWLRTLHRQWREAP